MAHYTYGRTMQVTLGDLIAVIMDEALESTGDEKMAGVIASRVLADVLSMASPQRGRDLMTLFATQKIDA